MNVSHPKVVIAEDDSDLLEALVREFRAAGFDVFTARNGVEGVSRVAQVRPHLIVLDVVMPERNGHEMMENLLSAYDWVQKIPVLVTTNYGAGETPTPGWMNQVSVTHVLKANVRLQEIVEEAKKLLQPAPKEVY